MQLREKKNLVESDPRSSLVFFLSTAIDLLL